MKFFLFFFGLVFFIPLHRQSRFNVTFIATLGLGFILKWQNTG